MSIVYTSPLTKRNITEKNIQPLTYETFNNDLKKTTFHIKQMSLSVVAPSHGLSNIILQSLGAVSIRKTVLPGMAIPMLKIRRPNGRLIFNMEIAIRR